MSHRDSSVLIVFNGPPASGKSTLARLVCEELDRCLHIDVDQVRDMIVGWELDKLASGLLARSLARSMAICHLSSGLPVVVSQLFGRPEDLDLFRGIAASQGAMYLELAVCVPRETAMKRFLQRGGAKVAALSDGSTKSVASEFDELYDRVESLTATRDGVISIESFEGDIPKTMAAVMTVLRGNGIVTEGV